MRFLAVVSVLLFCALDISAQEQVLLSGVNETGGFGGPVVKVTTINNQTAFMIGGRGGWIINHSLVLGGGGYAIINEVNAPEGAVPSEGPLDIHFEYFGLEVEYIKEPQALTHYGYSVLIGFGAVHYYKDVGPLSESTEQSGETDLAFVAEPGVIGEINITTWLHITAGVSYRFVAGVSLPKVKSEDFTGLAGTVTFKFGSF